MINALYLMAPDWAVAHAPILLILVPLMLAPLMAMQPSGRFAWLLSVLAAASSFIFACLIYAMVGEASSGAIEYALGGWAPPLGIAFRADALSVLFLLLLTGLGLAAAIFSWPTVKAELPAEKHAMVYAMFTLCLTGLAGVVITGDAFNLYVFLEIASIAAYALVAMGARRDRRALHAAYNYLIMGTIGATFYVIGLGFLYAATGTLNFAELARELPALAGERTVQAGFAFIFVGLGLKAALWPLHQWLPNAYTYAPSAATVLLSATSAKVAIYALVRFLFTIFDPDVAFIKAAFESLLMPLAIAAMLICSVQAAFQTDVRRIFAYSSVAQGGVILLGISLASVSGVSAGLLGLSAHALAKPALFMAVAGMVLTYEGATLKDFAGLGRAAPFTMTAFAIAAASLVGLPLTLGFQAKLQLGYALFERGWYAGAAALAAATFLSVIYAGRIFVTVFFDPPHNPRKQRKEAPALILVPLWTLALASLWFGINASWPADLSEAAARAVLQAGGAP